MGSVQGEIATVRVILDHGAEMEHPTREIWTPLLLASFFGNQDVVLELLGRGANPHARVAQGTRYKLGRNALEFARVQGHKGIVEVLLAWDQNDGKILG
jgi:ankyrin repeat protein